MPSSVNDYSKVPKVDASETIIPVGKVGKEGKTSKEDESPEKVLTIGSTEVDTEENTNDPESFFHEVFMGRKRI
jgi:hypothetical protein